MRRVAQLLEQSPTPKTIEERNTCISISRIPSRWFLQKNMEGSTTLTAGTTQANKFACFQDANSNANRGSAFTPANYGALERFPPLINHPRLQNAI
jgi:hypothetical protein